MGQKGWLRFVPDKRTTMPGCRSTARGRHELNVSWLTSKQRPFLLLDLTRYGCRYLTGVLLRSLEAWPQPSAESFHPRGRHGQKLAQYLSERAFRSHEDLRPHTCMPFGSYRTPSRCFHFGNGDNSHLNNLLKCPRGTHSTCMSVSDV